MMPIHEKIRLFRQAKGWTQDEVAEKLELSLNAYGEIERGNSDIRLSRLEQIANLFEVEVIDLLGATEINTFHFINSTGTQNNHNYSANGQMEMQTEIDKLQLMLQLKDKEIELRDEKIHHLSELVDLLKAKN
jgi:transcriptional regulator with XRE-family HTH domain